MIKVIISPMAGATDLPFRLTAAEFAPRAMMMTEMIPSEALVRFATGKRGLRMERLFDPIAPAPCIAQIFGSIPATMAEAAKICEGLGAVGIDINMGCPMPKITKNGAGSALMRSPELAASIVAAIAAAVKIPVSVKMRTGWTASSVNAPELARILAEAGASMISVHGRTREQMYSGDVDITAISAVKSAVRIPVMANGNVVSIEGARKILHDTGADGVMIGRGSMGRPWFPSDVLHYIETGEEREAPTNICEIALRHLERMEEHYGERVAALNAKKHMCWYARGMAGNAEIRRRIVSTTSVSEIRDALLECF